MIEYYGEIRFVHIAAVIASGTLFGLRGIAMLMGSGAGMVAPVRFVSYAIDTVLLSAALMLWAMLPSVTFANHWLTVKLLLVVLYVVLGSLALKRGRTQRIRALCFGAAALTFFFVLSIALVHHPAGFLSILAQTP